MRTPLRIGPRAGSIPRNYASVWKRSPALPGGSYASSRSPMLDLLRMLEQRNPAHAAAVELVVSRLLREPTRPRMCAMRPARPHPQRLGMKKQGGGGGG